MSLDAHPPLPSHSLFLCLPPSLRPSLVLYPFLALFARDEFAAEMFMIPCALHSVSVTVKVHLRYLRGQLKLVIVNSR